MASERQTRANRLNAMKSTGPRTEAGKAASARNALRHGLSAKAVVVPGEDPAQFDVLRQAMVAELAPIGEVEELLVDRIVGLFWRLRRVPVLEAALLTWITHGKAPNQRVTAVNLGGVFIPASITPANAWHVEAGIGASEAHQRQTIGRALATAFSQHDVLNKLGRYEKELLRQLERTLVELDRANGRGHFARLQRRRT